MTQVGLSSPHDIRHLSLSHHCHPVSKKNIPPQGFTINGDLKKEKNVVRQDSCPVCQTDSKLKSPVDS